MNWLEYVKDPFEHNELGLGRVRLVQLSQISRKLWLFLAFSNPISLEITTCNRFSRKFTRMKTC